MMYQLEVSGQYSRISQSQKQLYGDYIRRVKVTHPPYLDPEIGISLPLRAAPGPG